MIRIEGIRKRFGPLEVLRGASMSVGRGEVAALIGASGSGKSTLLRCLNGLESHDDGVIEIAGQSLPPRQSPDRPSPAMRALRRRVGMVFQQFNLFPHLSVLQNVMLGPIYAHATPRAEAAERARALLARVGLADKERARPATLSGGQQQRVAIARTLANQPEVILFDEPTSALDPRMTAEVLAVMADLAGEGMTMLVVSHAMGFVRRSAGTVHVFAKGEIVESGPPQQIFEGANHPQTQALLADAEQT